MIWLLLLIALAIFSVGFAMGAWLLGGHQYQSGWDAGFAAAHDEVDVREVIPAEGSPFVRESRPVDPRFPDRAENRIAPIR